MLPQAHAHMRMHAQAEQQLARSTRTEQLMSPHIPYHQPTHTLQTTHLHIQHVALPPLHLPTPAHTPDPPPLPPPADKDVIGLAQTGSGKTGAFSLPILQQLMDKPQELFAMVLSPTRELAIQIAEQIEALGAGIGVKCAVLVGGIDLMSQVGAGQGQGCGTPVQGSRGMHCTACSPGPSGNAWGSASLVLLAMAAAMARTYSRCTAGVQ